MKSYGGRRASACGNGQTKSWLEQQHWPEKKTFVYIERTLIVRNGPCVYRRVSNKGGHPFYLLVRCATFKRLASLQFHTIYKHMYYLVPVGPLAYICQPKTMECHQAEYSMCKRFSAVRLACLAIEIETNECGANFKGHAVQETAEKLLTLPFCWWRAHCVNSKPKLTLFVLWQAEASTRQRGKNLKKKHTQTKWNPIENNTQKLCTISGEFAILAFFCVECPFYISNTETENIPPAIVRVCVGPTAQEAHVQRASCGKRCFHFVRHLTACQNHSTAHQLKII